MPSFSYLSLIYTEELMLGFSDPVDHVHSRAFHVIRFYESLSVTLRLTQDRWRSCSPVIISPAQERLHTEGMVIGFQLKGRPSGRRAKFPHYTTAIHCFLARECGPTNPGLPFPTPTGMSITAT